MTHVATNTMMFASVSGCAQAAVVRIPEQPKDERGDERRRHGTARADSSVVELDSPRLAD